MCVCVCVIPFLFYWILAPIQDLIWKQYRIFREWTCLSVRSFPFYWILALIQNLIWHQYRNFREWTCLNVPTAYTYSRLQIHVFSLILVHVERYKNVVATGEVINKSAFKNAKFTWQWNILNKNCWKMPFLSHWVEHDFLCATMKMKALCFFKMSGSVC
jgi:hypothetical protein